MAQQTIPAMNRPRSKMGTIVAIAVLLGPALLVGVVALNRRASLPPALWVGAGAAIIVGLGSLRFVSGRPLRSPLTALPAAIGAIAIGIARPAATDPVGPAVMGVLVLMAGGLFAGYALVATGALALRRAAKLAAQLAARREWPDSLDACRQVPEVKSLREAARDEAAPVLSLLTDPRPQVRIAALASLEYRRHWRRGQPDLVLEITRTEPLPELRAAAVLALGGVNLRVLIEELAHSLLDPSPLVRQAAADALLWDCEQRWIWVRHAVHEALADPRHARDEALQLSVGTFSDQAVSDLAAWATEAGPLGVRATQTLALHYSQRLAERPDPKLVAQLKDHVASTKASAILRIELAGLLRHYNQFTPDLLDRLLDAANPSPLRLMAVEAIMQHGGANDLHAIEVLRQIARQPNRELALSAAAVVQKYMQVDLGLAIGEPVPALHTRQAAEVTRRVIQWADQAPLPPLPPSRIPAGLKSSLLTPPAATPAPADPALAPLEWD